MLPFGLMLSNLGNSRSAHAPDHLLHTPDAFVRAPLPGMRQATAIVHAAPALGARFLEYIAEMEAGGLLGSTTAQRFVYVLEGSLQIEDHPLLAGSFAYLPQGHQADVRAMSPSCVAVIEKPYQPSNDAPPPLLHVGREADVAREPLLGDSDVCVQTLLPASPAHDFAVNIINFVPGAALPMVESHVMEHGLLMLAGSGIYRLNQSWYPVTAGDFIWMAPYCPQWFAAVGKTPARYLIYKDWHRSPL